MFIRKVESGSKLSRKPDPKLPISLIQIFIKKNFKDENILKIDYTYKELFVRSGTRG
jgi:hypothetical protein